MTTFASRKLRPITIAASFLAVLAATVWCGVAVAAPKSGSKAVLVSIQPVNDKGVMQDFVKGFNEGAKKYNYSAAKVVIVTNASAYISTLQAVAGKFDLVVTTFPPMIQAVDTVAPKFPKTHFVLLDAQTTKPHPNVQTLFFKENESSFLAGIVAGSLTKTNKVGFLGALVQDVINRYLVGFYEGAKMELNGALSNPLVSDKCLDLARLAAAKRKLLLGERAPDRLPSRLSRRQGSVLATVTSVLELAGKPMRVWEIHAAVEQLIGEPVPYSSVKEALSAHTRGGDRRFRRTGRGCYELP